VGGGDPPTPTWAAAPGSHRPATSLSQILPSCRPLRPKKAQSASEHATERGGRAARLYPLGNWVTLTGEGEVERVGGRGQGVRLPIPRRRRPLPRRVELLLLIIRVGSGGRRPLLSVIVATLGTSGAGRGQKEKKLPPLPLGSSAEPGRAISGVS